MINFLFLLRLTVFQDSQLNLLPFMPVFSGVVKDFFLFFPPPWGSQHR
jgi:hypothetical protein